jgi:hypothetical protein
MIQKWLIQGFKLSVPKRPVRIMPVPLKGKPIFMVAALTATLLATALGFFLHGGTRGLYSDDYSQRAWAFDFETGSWRLQMVPHHVNFRFLHSVLTPNLVNAIPRHEFPVRLFWVLVHYANTLLLGLVAYRFIRTPFVFVTTEWLFLMPILANEAVLWHAANAVYLLSLLAFLIGLHLYLTALSKWRPTLLLAAALFLGIVPLFCEAIVFVVLLFPIFSLQLTRDTRARLRLFLSASVFCGLMMLAYGIYWYFILRHAPQIGSRGGFTFDPFFVFRQRVPEVGRRLVWLVAGWGICGPLAEALQLGTHEWLGTWPGWILLVALLASVLITALTYPAPNSSNRQSRLAVWGTVLVGLVWAGLTLVPILLVRNQIVEIRTLYPTWAGLSLSIAALMQGIVDFIGRWRLFGIRISLIIIGVILLLSSLTMAGIVRAYQLRWNLDQRQLAAFRMAIPVLPNVSPIWLLPVTLDERSVSPYIGRETLLDKYLFGVFEIPWSAAAALKMEYRRVDILAVASHRWDKLHLTGVIYSPEGNVVGLVIQNIQVPITHLIAFTYQEGHVILLNPLIIEANGDEIVVNLPLVTLLERPGVLVQPIHFQLESP